MVHAENDTLKEGLHVITTGGTLDFTLSQRFEVETGQFDSLVPRKHSIVPHFLTKRVKVPSDSIEYSRICLKDSREITDEDRSHLRDAIVQSPYRSVLVTHGIADMETTVAYLRENPLEGKVVGVVGSRMPLEWYRSDAGFNIGYAIGQLQGVENGVHMFHPTHIRDRVQRSLDNLVFLITGGTIDSFFDERKDTPRPFSYSAIPSYLTGSIGVEPPEPDFVFKQICMKDSRELDEVEVRELLDSSSRSAHKSQIITAGTYALPDLANRFDHLLTRGEMPQSRYVFVGAMFPEDVYLNDGWFNLGYALGKMDHIDKGAHVAMHGWVTRPDNVMKQLANARFALYNPQRVY